MAKRRTWTVSELASATELDVEQVLVALWSEGVEYPLQPSSRIRPEDVGIAERATGLAGSRQKRISYWLGHLGMTRSELVSFLEAGGIRLHPAANTVPKGAIRRLRVAPVPRVLVDSPLSIDPELPAAAPFTWVPIGNPRQCEYLSAEEIEQVHEELTIDFAASDDPISPPGLMSRALLESAAGRPATSLGDTCKYSTVESAAAALLHSLVQNHPFHNGNKRSALVSMLVFLDRHGFVLESSQDELFKFMIRVAAHDLLDSSYSYDMKADREVAAIAAWVAKRSRTIRREDRAITWRELSRLLKNLDCEVDGAKGEWVVIRRSVRVRRGFLLGDRQKSLEFNFRNTSAGRDVPRSVIKRMRRDLELDPENGFDAEVFYGGANGPDYFILLYSQLLKRLAQV
jgi:death-on-curing family protein